jgi:hypothetical protein
MRRIPTLAAASILACTLLSPASATAADQTPMPGPGGGTCQPAVPMPNPHAPYAPDVPHAPGLPEAPPASQLPGCPGT